MVSHKCVEEFGYKGYNLPANARANRSPRKKPSSVKKKTCEDDEMSPMDLLATVAENLLFDSGSSPMSIDKPVNDNCVVTQKTVKDEFAVDEKPLKPVTLFEDITYQGSLSTSSVINGKVENENFSNSDGSDSFQVQGVDDDAVVLYARSNYVVSLGSNSSRTELPSMGNGVSHGVRDDVNLFCRDDDENFSGRIRPQVIKRSPRFVPRVGDKRIRKRLASRHWKGGSQNDSKPWRTNYLHHQRSYPIKNRRYFDNISDSISNDYCLRTKMQRGSSAVSSKKGRAASFLSSHSHVRLRIKSLRVPELFVEIPDSATVGSLKRMVMEAVSTLVSDGHRVGLMVHGKKVLDDNKTLHQTGISQDKTHLDSLDFNLEPSSEVPQLLASYPAGHAWEELLPLCHAANADNVLEFEHDSALFPFDPLSTKNTTNDFFLA